jgi:hypothetical protein
MEGPGRVCRATHVACALDVLVPVGELAVLLAPTGGHPLLEPAEALAGVRARALRRPTTEVAMWNDVWNGGSDGLEPGCRELPLRGRRYAEQAAESGIGLRLAALPALVLAAEDLRRGVVERSEQASRPDVREGRFEPVDAEPAEDIDHLGRTGAARRDPGPDEGRLGRRSRVGKKQDARVLHGGDRGGGGRARGLRRRLVATRASGRDEEQCE